MKPTDIGDITFDGAIEKRNIVNGSVPVCPRECADLLIVLHRMAVDHTHDDALSVWAALPEEDEEDEDEKDEKDDDEKDAAHNLSCPIHESTDVRTSGEPIGVRTAI